MYTNAGCSRLLDYYFVVSCDDRDVDSIKETLNRQSLAPRNQKTARHASFVFKPKIIDRYPDTNHIDTPILPWIARTIMCRGIKTITHPPSPTFSSFVGWNIDSSKLYISCLLVFQKIHINNQLHSIYIPKTLGFVSHYPYFCAFQVFLRFLWHNAIHKQLLSKENVLFHYFHNISAPVPSRKTSCNLGQTKVLLSCRNEFDVPISELPIEITFTLLTEDKILFILKLLLLEKRVIFICDNTHQLTPVCELFISLLFPLRWRHLYLPLLSHEMFQGLTINYNEVEDAPFIVGSHTANDHIMPMNSFLVFLDRNEITDYKKKAIRRNDIKSGMIVPNLPNQLETTLRDAIHRLSKCNHNTQYMQQSLSQCALKESPVTAFKRMFAVMTKLLYLSAHPKYAKNIKDGDSLFIIKFRKTNLFKSFYAYYKRINGDNDPSFIKIYRLYEDNEGHGEEFGHKVKDKEIFNVSSETMRSLGNNNSKDNKLKNEIAINRSNKYIFPTPEFQMSEEAKKFLRIYIWGQSTKNNHKKKSKSITRSYSNSFDTSCFSLQRKMENFRMELNDNKDNWGRTLILCFDIEHEIQRQIIERNDAEYWKMVVYDVFKDDIDGKMNLVTIVAKISKLEILRCVLDVFHLEEDIDTFCLELEKNEHDIKKALNLCLEMEKKIQYQKMAENDDDKPSQIVCDIFDTRNDKAKAILATTINNICRSYPSEQEHLKLLRSVIEIFDEMDSRSVMSFCSNTPSTYIRSRDSTGDSWTPDVSDENDKKYKTQIIDVADTDHKLKKRITIKERKNERPSVVKNQENVEHPSFKQQIIKCEFSNSLDGCDCIQRIIDALMYYSLLNVVTNRSDQNKLVKYCTEMYKSFLDDYIHIVNNHSNDIDAIYDLMQPKLTKCDWTNCVLLQRHHRNRADDDKQQRETIKHAKKDKDFVFYRDIMDSLHCYLYHLYDVGFRVKTEDAAISTKDGTLYENYYVDMQIKNILKAINQKQNKLKHIDGFNAKRFDNTKFNIHTVYNNYHKETFMDCMYQFMLNAKSSKIEILKTKLIINAQEYDSESLQQDMEDMNEFDVQSNIKNMIPYGNHYDLIKEFIQLSKLSRYSFSIGYIFYYWTIYKYEGINKEKQSYRNKNNHSGYEPYELYIELKYKDMKEEVLNNEIFQLSIYEFSVTKHKTAKYVGTKIVNSTKSDSITERIHRYGIKPGTTLSFNNVLSIILYCDWSDLQNYFSSTFRKSSPYETIESVKQRNREYANWSKTLRETVEYFGQRGYDNQKSEKWNKLHNRIRGPFFCGMSFMVIPEFNIRLCGPTSTSKQNEVATRFGGDEGILIQLNNNGHRMSKELRSFNCAWLSCYSGEDEHLFIGGYYTIKVETIININTNTNFHVFFEILFYFDCMISGTDIGVENKPNITKQHCSILVNLIQHKLKLRQNKLKNYINSTFTSFTNHKKEIVVNMHHIKEYFQPISHVISRELIDSLSNKRRKSLNFIYILKDVILKLFSNITHITIYSTNKQGTYQYQFNKAVLLALNKSLDVHNLEIQINATNKYKSIKKKNTTTHKMEIIGFECTELSWIHKLWKLHKKSIKKAFRNHQYQVKFFEINDGTKYHLQQGCMRIYKQCSKPD